MTHIKTRQNILTIYNETYASLNTSFLSLSQFAWHYLSMQNLA